MAIIVDGKKKVEFIHCALNCSRSYLFGRHCVSLPFNLRDSTLEEH